MKVTKQDNILNFVNQRRDSVFGFESCCLPLYVGSQDREWSLEASDSTQFYI